MPSNRPSSTICLRISSSISEESTSELLSKDRRLDWCSICLARDLDSAVSAALVLGPSCRRCASCSRLLRCLDSSLVGTGVDSLTLCLIPRWYDPGPRTLDSARLCSRISSIILLSSSSSLVSLRRRTCGTTSSPGLYLRSMSFFSCADLPFPGFACEYMSSKVVTVAFGLVSRTEARHDGHVSGFSVESVA